MQYHKQLFLHEPEKGQTGDCFRTCLACLLDMNPADVPHFMEDFDKSIAETWASVDDWLETRRGLRFVDLPFDAPDSPELFLKGWGQHWPGLRFILSGVSPRGTDHATVWDSTTKTVWDPHPDGGGIVGPMSNGYYYIGFLLPVTLHGTSPRGHALRKEAA